MSETGKELYSLLIPLAERRLLVPRACVAEVVGFSAPEGNGSDFTWYLGGMLWDGRLVPTISFEGCCGDRIPEAGRRSRVVIFHATGSALPGRFFGIVSQGFPQLVRVNPGVLSTEPDVKKNDDLPILCQLRMVNEYPLVPDLEKLEEMIHDAVET